ncbi:MAG: hypothetical protein RLZZ383_1615, partial [Pseudomonadota bacterium]
MTRAQNGQGRSWLVVAAFSVGWAFLLLLIGLVSVAGPIASLVQEGVPVAELGGRLQALLEGPEGIAVTATTLAIQFPLMFALAEGVRRFSWRAVWEASGPLPSLRVGYGWHGWGGGRVLAAAVVAGATTGWAPGWIAGQLREAFPGYDLGGVAMVNDALAAGTPWQVGCVVGAVVVGAPVVEELVFRGVLWDAFARTMSPIATWLVASFVFAAYHMDPFQAVPLLFTAGVIGWFRHRTGSVAPGMLVHFLNNALGVGIGALGIADATL